MIGRTPQYQICEKVLGEKLIAPQEDLGGFGVIEQDVLEEIMPEKQCAAVACVQIAQR